MSLTFPFAVPCLVPLFEDSQNAGLSDTEYFTKPPRIKRTSNRRPEAQRASGHELQSRYLSPHLPEVAGLLEQWNDFYKSHMMCTVGYESPRYWGVTLQGLNTLHICHP